MYLRALLAASFLVLVGADPAPTPAPLPSPLSLQQAFRDDHEFKQRALSEGEQVCWSRNSICDEWGDLDDACDAYPIVSDAWYKCICGTGWVAAHAACNWCLSFYGEVTLSDDQTWTDACSDNDLSISPLPASIIAIESSFNATNTWLATDQASNAAPTSAAATTDDEITTPSRTSRQASSTPTFTGGGGIGSVFPTDTSRSISRQTSTTTMFGGNGGAPLSSSPTDQNDAGPPTVTVTAAAGGGGGGAAAGLNVKAAATLSGVIAILTIVGVAIFQF